MIAQNDIEKFSTNNSIKIARTANGCRHERSEDLWDALDASIIPIMSPIYKQVPRILFCDITVAAWKKL